MEIIFFLFLIPKDLLKEDGLRSKAFHIDYGSLSGVGFYSAICV